MREQKNYSLILKDLLSLEFSPVAISCLKEPYLKSFSKKVRICRAILDSGKGEILQVNRKNNACFGAAWHLGFNRFKDQKIMHMVKKFVVEGEKLFSSYESLERLIEQMEELPDNRDAYFVLSPLEKADFIPQTVIFICNAEQACRL
ncbi:MAG: DUF169 domain-containing protein, partial [Candidatus Omnitrophica bacterium]|nr:DUF169 domain-containing protein [Candidatus Omnitrophota bacterium]